MHFGWKRRTLPLASIRYIVILEHGVCGPNTAGAEVLAPPLLGPRRGLKIVYEANGNKRSISLLSRDPERLAQVLGAGRQRARAALQSVLLPATTRLPASVRPRP